MIQDTLPAAADCRETRSRLRGEQRPSAAPPPSYSTTPGAPPGPPAASFTDLGLVEPAGDAPAPRGPGAGAEPPPDSGYLDTTPNRENPPDNGTCGGRWLVRRCGCKAVLVWAYGCGRRGCPRCGLQKCQASGERLFDRLYGQPETHLQALVLTVPPSARPDLAGPAGGERWSVALRTFVAVLRERFSFTWCYVRSHPRGDESPDFAPHANLIGLQASGSGRLDVDALRAAWSAALGVEGVVDLFASFFKLDDYAGVAALKHWCAYVERAFPGWSWSGQWARWYGDHMPMKTERTEKADKGICPDCGLSHNYNEPEDSELISVAALEAIIETGDPVPPAEWRRWRRLDPPPKQIVPTEPARWEQSSLFSAGHHGQYS